MHCVADASRSFACTWIFCVDSSINDTACYNSHISADTAYAVTCSAVLTASFYFNRSWAHRDSTEIRSKISWQRKSCCLGSPTNGAGQICSQHTSSASAHLSFGDRMDANGVLVWLAQNESLTFVCRLKRREARHVFARSATVPNRLGRIIAAFVKRVCYAWITIAHGSTTASGMATMGHFCSSFSVRSFPVCSRVQQEVCQMCE